jgi:hypothetical protein
LRDILRAGILRVVGVVRGVAKALTRGGLWAFRLRPEQVRPVVISVDPPRGRQTHRRNALHPSAGDESGSPGR